MFLLLTELTNFSRLVVVLLEFEFLFLFRVFVYNSFDFFALTSPASERNIVHETLFIDDEAKAVFIARCHSLFKASKLKRDFLDTL